jgi:AraC family transcriptional regulator of adaptative response/methylated-DNA-[protein]-cysteine methyltransferase
MADLFAPLTPSLADMESAWERRDAAFDGAFVFGVRTTGIYCRPSCSSRSRRENIEFFATITEALRAGYRPCKRCRPDEANGEAPKWVRDLMRTVQDDPETVLRAEDLRSRGIAPEKARRWFQKHYGMTFAAWARAVRLGSAFTRIRNGESLDATAFDHGYASASGFREAFGNLLGQPPGRSREGVSPLFAKLMPTPVGPMIAVAGEGGVALLEFTDVRGLERQFASMRRKLGRPVLPGEHAMLTALESQLGEYFAGQRSTFDLPLLAVGSDFQKEVWGALRQIPFGQTISYRELAERIGRPSACRAVARANGSNRLYLLVPCHRVIGKDDSPGGYGGGVWRKQWLLAHERP